jgi:ERCC4-related helicase
MKELTLIIEEKIPDNKDLFEADEYQIYVSAVSLAYAEKCFFATIPSGQGKTIIMLLNALYEIVSRNAESVCFVSCSEILSD